MLAVDFLQTSPEVIQDMHVAKALRTQEQGAARPVRLVLVGCGKIAEEIHLPILAGHEGAQLTALVDRDEMRARRFADAYRVTSVFSDVAKIPKGQFDAAVIATPPFHHAPAAIDLMRCGLHVLVEKPMALSVAQAEEMCRVAEEEKVVLAVGLYKRLLPVTRLLKYLVQCESWGVPKTFSYEWGGLGGYASTTLGLMRKEYAGGGVLMDLGAHAFDQLLTVFGQRGRVLSYRDDSRGGIEADCTAELAFGDARGTVALSRVRNLANRLEIECERATLAVALNERFEVTVRPHGGEPVIVRAPGSIDVPWFESYRAEIDDWLEAISGRKPSELSGLSALPTVALVEACYEKREPLQMPWTDSMPKRAAPKLAKPTGKVLITGAGGFIGSRVAEILVMRDRCDVRAMVRGAASAGRLARMPIEMVQGDLRSDADIRRAVEGCAAVIHCAVGTAYGQLREIEAVTVGGTERLAKACRDAGVRRLVHLSSIGVHDSKFVGVIDGSTPVAPPRDDWYGRTKARAEDVLREEEQRGLSVAILRPGCVYGPYGFTFVINPLRALAEGRLVLANAAESPANTVFVDNLVESVVCALLADDDAVRGRAFAIGDGDDCTWGTFYRWFAERMGCQVIETEGIAAPQPHRAGVWAGIKMAFTSPEAMALAKYVLQSDPLGTAPRWVLERFPGVETWLREMMGKNEPLIYRRPQHDAVAGPVVFTPRAGHVSIAEARQHLGFTPPVSREEAQQLTWEWVRYARIA